MCIGAPVVPRRSVAPPASPSVGAMCAAKRSAVAPSLGLAAKRSGAALGHVPTAVTAALAEGGE